MQLTLDVHANARESMPDADTDVLVWCHGEREAQLGAYVGDDEDGPIWVNAHGEGLATVVAWAELPLLPA